MAGMLRKLNDPQLVASIQRFCGIHQTSGQYTLDSNPSLSDNQPDSDSDSQNHVSNNGIRSENSFENGDVKISKRNVKQTSDVCPSELNNGCNKNSDSEHKLKTSKSTASLSPPSSDDENSAGYVIKNKPLHYLMEFGASFGNELFYITFFPYWFWNIDGYVGRRVCVFWCIFMYLGQATKDIVKWPRPASPPVVQLEKRYALEYGMPSTHAMVGAGLPFSILILTYERYEYPVYWGLLISIIWCSLVCCSRIYLGMHSVLDVLAGLVYVFGLMALCLPYMDVIDHFMITSPYSPLVCVLVPLGLCLCYPTLDRWSTARGDTTLILAVASGIGVGHWVSYQYGFMQRATTLPPYQIIYPTWTWFGQMTLRLAFGVVILFATRTVMKLLSYNFVCYLTGVNKEDMKSKQKLSIELPYKFATYSVVSFAAVAFAPLVFRYLGIERETYFTEI